MWGFSCRRDLFHGFARLVHASGDELLKTTLGLTTGWHARLRALIEATAPETINVFEVKSAERIAPWNTGRVTLLGDALHNMTRIAAWERIWLFSMRTRSGAHC